MLALLLAYFSGYVSLQMHPRHCFHLEFVHLWFFGFVIERVVDAFRAWRESPPPAACSARMLKRSLAFVALLAAAAGAPLAVAGAVQAHNAAALREAWNAASIEAIPCTSRTIAEWTVFDVRETLPQHPCSPPHRFWNFGVDYMAVELIADGRDVFLWQKYEADSPRNDFSHLLRFPAKQAPKGARIRCLFPVFHHFLPPAFSPLYGDRSPQRNAQARSKASAAPIQHPFLCSRPWRFRKTKATLSAASASVFSGRPRRPGSRPNSAILGGIRNSSTPGLAATRTVWRRRAALDPPNLMLAARRAELAESSGRPEEAAAIRMEAMRRNPRTPEVYWLAESSGGVGGRSRGESGLLGSANEGCSVSVRGFSGRFGAGRIGRLGGRAVPCAKGRENTSRQSLHRAAPWPRSCCAWEGPRKRSRPARPPSALRRRRWRSN